MPGLRRYPAQETTLPFCRMSQREVSLHLPGTNTTPRIPPTSESPQSPGNTFKHLQGSKKSLNVFARRHPAALNPTEPARDPTAKTIMSLPDRSVFQAAPRSPKARTCATSASSAASSAVAYPGLSLSVHSPSRVSCISNSLVLPQPTSTSPPPWAWSGYRLFHFCPLARCPSRQDSGLLLRSGCKFAERSKSILSGLHLLTGRGFTKEPAMASGQVTTGQQGWQEQSRGIPTTHSCTGDYM